MAFQTSPGEDFNFQKYGVTNGGSSTSRIEGRERTQEELLNHAASLPAPNSHIIKISVKIRLKELRALYHDDNWHRHYSQTKFERKAETDETIQSIPPGE